MMVNNYSKFKIIQHTILSDQGGTAMIAGLINSGLNARGWKSRVRSEIREGRGSGQAVSMKLEPQTVVHIHSTLDWPATLDSCQRSEIRPLVTLHDASLITGGCVYPLECTQWIDGCPECSRGYRDSEQSCSAKRQRLRVLGPFLISPSKWLAEMAQKVFQELEVRVIPNGVSPESGLQSNAHGLPDFSGDLVLFVAHGGTKAGYRSGTRWLSVWKMIKDACPAARALFVGSQKMARTGDVFELPHIPNSTLRSLMGRASVLVYPSLADNHPLVVLEAMMGRLPVAAFAAGGIPEQIRSAETGMLVKPGNYEALAMAAVHILKNKARAQKMAEKAFFRAMSMFSAEKMVQNYVRVYEKVINIQETY